ncbi:MAG: Mo-co oxidoreductase dimerization domain protein, partial [Desertimonas sp.]|nr:Mo-co oxidoreductase dimerization domain protein [Desertimonas sp.]
NFGVRVIGDKDREGHETFFVEVLNPFGASIADGQGAVTILDDDGAVRAGAIGDSATTPLDIATARAVLAAAAATWGAALQGIDLSTVTIEIADLPLDILAQTSPDGTTIVIDVDAAGWGWHIDPSSPVGAASIDLLSVLAHELGHVLGIEHGASELMGEVIEPGRRDLPTFVVTTATATVPATVGVASAVAVTSATEAFTPFLPNIDLTVARTVMDVPPLVGPQAVAVAVAQPVLERAVEAVSAVSPSREGAASPDVPATVWWLLIGLGMVLSALRRCRPLHRSRQ